MRYQHVCVETVSFTIPPNRVTSDEIEEKLKPMYDRLGLPAGRLELMTGIKERCFFDSGTLPGEISATTASKAIQESGIDLQYFGALIHGSVCRDQLEPATATGVHHLTGIPNSAFVFDVSNACLGILSGMMMIANMIELGQIKAGVVVGTEVGRNLVEATIDHLLSNEELNRNDIKAEFASLTIGSGSAAIVLCDEKLSSKGHKLMGGACRADTSSHELCAGGVDSEKHGDSRPRMQTNSEALLHAGIDLAVQTWEDTKMSLGWKNEDVDKVFTHQVGKAHRKLLLDRVDLDLDLDYPTVQKFGNTGAAALPMAMGLGIENGHLQFGDKVALLGIGSGLNSAMLGIQWN